MVSIMKRHILNKLLQWKNNPSRKPLLLRGARQVGKTYIIREFGKSAFKNLVEINFDFDIEAKHVFAKDLSPKRIVRDLALLTGIKIIPGETLLFFDEVQEEPNAIKALRYFSEEMPELHVIATGSLLDFAIESIGVPVGRISFLYMYPMSFLEFLIACKEDLLAEELIQHNNFEPLNEAIHSKLLDLVGIYIAVGGMPEVVKEWINTGQLRSCQIIQSQLIDAYRQDFQKYAKKLQIKYLDILFKRIPFLLGKLFKYSNISQEYRARELMPCLDLLCKAGIVREVLFSSGNGIPLGAEADFKKFKVIFLDIALAQNILGVDIGSWITNSGRMLTSDLINKGGVVEAFIGQELLAYSDPYKESNLYYWQSFVSGGAEVDYLIQQDGFVIPVEVKSSLGTSLKSMRKFLAEKADSPYGVRFSTHNYSSLNNLRSYPLYAVASMLKGK